ncbi:MAG TPA: hypothetical protein VE133_07575, partial [Candidatus Sulfotelmatobacter sp.]|nr:hypothetical protein [Candidatus Sulfotelmatobacter sp.]
FFRLSGVRKRNALGILLGTTLIFVIAVAALTTAYFFSQRRNYPTRVDHASSSFNMALANMKNAALSGSSD